MEPTSAIVQTGMAEPGALQIECNCRARAATGEKGLKVWESNCQDAWIMGSKLSVSGYFTPASATKQQQMEMPA